MSQGVMMAVRTTIGPVHALRQRGGKNSAMFASGPASRLREISRVVRVPPYGQECQSEWQ
jgi:hypothetical protein